MNILAECERRGIRIEADGDTLKVDAPKGALSPDLVEALKVRKPEILATLNLNTLLVEACQGVPGIDAATFRSLLSPEDVQDIAGGHIPMVTLNAYAQSFAEGIRTGRNPGACRRRSKNHAALARALCRLPALQAGHRALQDRRRRDRIKAPGTMGERRT